MVGSELGSFVPSCMVGSLPHTHRHPSRGTETGWPRSLSQVSYGLTLLVTGYLPIVFAAGEAEAGPGN